jgi:cytochrome bd ubiquinol oxidase subunit I
VLARQVAHHQPAKLAAIEALFQTEQGAAFRIGGTVDTAQRTIKHAIEIPRALSLLLYHDPDATVTGLEAFPPEDWPPVGVVHWAFQIMVAAGFAMAAVSIWAAVTWWRRRQFAHAKWLLRAIVLVSPLGFIATEAGWVVTEVGRQPWIIYGVLRTSHAVTPMPGLIVPLILFSVVYVLLAATVVGLLFRQISTVSRLKAV